MASGTLNSVTRSEGCYVWKLIWEMWKRNQVANRVCGQRFYRKSLLIRYTLCSALILSKRCPLSNNFFGLAISQRNNCCHQRYILLSVLSNRTHFLFLGGWRGGVNNNFKRGYETGLPNISLCLVTWTFREASRSIAAYFPELVSWHQISKE